MAAPTAKGPNALVTERAWKATYAESAPTRPDDTVVLSDGKRATLEEVQTYVVQYLARRAGESDG
jgi:hypothetical protein